MGGSLRTRTLIVCGALAVWLAVLWLGWTDRLPQAIASRIMNNSEVWCFLVLMVPWIQFVLPAVPRSRFQRWVVVFGVAATLLVGGLLLRNSIGPRQIWTFNEPVIAAAVLVPYMSLARPLPRPVRLVALLTPIVLAVTAVILALPEPGEKMQSTNVGIQQAEMLMLVLLTVISVDFIDTGILDPKARTVRSRRLVWYTTLLALPLIVVLLGADARVGAALWNLVANVLGRSHEAFLGTLLLCLIFAVFYGRIGIRSRGRRALRGGPPTGEGADDPRPVTA